MKAQKFSIAIIVGLIILGIVAYFVLTRVQNMAVMQAKGDAMREGFTEAKGLLGRFTTPQQYGN